MKANKTHYFKSRLLHLLAIMLLALVTEAVIAQDKIPMTEPERKADYFERIYFSGANHEKINGLYLASIQQLENKQLSPLAAKQYDLLLALEKDVYGSSNSCGALEIIAAAIYELDADIAMKHQIQQPSGKTKVNLQNSVGAVRNKTDSSTKVGNAIDRYNEYNEYLGILKDIFKKDKPCKTIIPKVVEIGYHPNALEAVKNEKKEIAGKAYKTQSYITINKVNFSQVTEIKSKLKKIEGIVEVKSGDFKDNVVVFEIMHNIEIDEIINQIVNQKMQYKLVVESITGDDGILMVK